jgi:glucose dehydrogenase
MKRWQGFALLLLTIQVPAFAEGIDLQNTRSFQGGPINDETVSQLRVKWVYQTAPDTGTASNAQGSISSTPAVDGAYLYFNDMSGYLTKLNRFTGKLVWRKNYVNDLSVPGFVAKGSRNTPHVKGDLIIVGSNMGLVDRLCRMIPGATPSALGCASGDGAIVLAINKHSGQVVWRTKAETGRRIGPGPTRTSMSSRSTRPRTIRAARRGEAWWPWMSVRGRFAGSDIPTSGMTPIMS